MPGSTMHLFCSYQYIKNNNIPLPADFLLGSIAPDAVNPGDIMAPKAVRWAAHLRNADLCAWELCALEFYRKKREALGSYALGFFYHILTDVVWDRMYNDDLKRFFIALGDRDGNLPKRKELQAYGALLRQRPWWNEICLLLESAEPKYINGISSDLQKAQLNRIFSEERQKISDRPVFITDGIMDNFTKALEKRAAELLATI